MESAWLDEPGNGGELADLDYIDPAAIRAQTPRMISRVQTFGDVVLARFVALCRRQIAASTPSA